MSDDLDLPYLTLRIYWALGWRIDIVTALTWNTRRPLFARESETKNRRNIERLYLADGFSASALVPLVRDFVEPVEGGLCKDKGPIR